MKGIAILGLTTTVVADLLDEHPMFVLFARSVHAIVGHRRRVD
jgi:hypothetical protein